MGNIFVTSDLHFNHDKDFCYKPRNFNSVEEMNLGIFNNYNRVVKADDDVYILGDLMLGDNEKGLEFIRNLNGRLHIVCGNHDTDNRRLLYQSTENIVEVADSLYLKYEGYRFFMSHYPSLCSTIISGRSLKRSLINLCGHSHTDDPFADFNKGLIYHCEVDAHDCAPVRIEKIILDLENKWLEL